MRALLCLAAFIALASCEDDEIEFMPARESGLMQRAASQMQTLAHSMEEMFGRGDQSTALKRGAKTGIAEHFESHPAPGFSIEIDIGRSDDETPKKGGIFSKLSEMMKKRVQAMQKSSSNLRKMIERKARHTRKSIKQKMRRLRHGMPRWMRKMRRSPRKMMLKRMRKMWYRNILLKACPEAATKCPNTKCPKAITRCLMAKQGITPACQNFLADVKGFKSQKQEIKRTFKASKRQCKQSKDPKARHTCIHQAKRAKKQAKKALRSAFKTKMEAAQEAEPKKAITVEQIGEERQATSKFVLKKMKALSSLFGINRALSQEAQQAQERESAAPSPLTEEREPEEELAEVGAGCKTDTDCHAGGDMGGYCKANGDCHCTAPFFASDGHTCALSCTPTSHPTACCRDNADCTKDGDKAAYCKSPKSTLHTTPGNGQCRCGTGYTGTTSCHKEKDTLEKHERHMIGGQGTNTPAWLTGDIEAPLGEKDMGGWVARVYTAEQQARLGVDEMGEPPLAAKMGEPPLAAKLQTLQLADSSSSDSGEKEAEKEEEEARWLLGGSAMVMCISGSAVVALLLALLLVQAKRRSRQATELSAVYSQAMGSAAQI